MPLPVVTNVPSINAQRNLTISTAAVNKSLERLSSGLRINHSGDDAAGMAISEDMQSQINGTKQAIRNASDGLSMIGTADGAIGSYTAMVQRIRVLAVQSANDTYSPANREVINKEAQDLIQELQRMVDTISFNGIKLLDGTVSDFKLQVGPNAYETITFSLLDLSVDKIGAAYNVGTGQSPFISFAGGNDNLVINGVDVLAGFNVTAADAISVAKQISKMTSTATAYAREVTDAAYTGATNLTQAAANDFMINGIQILNQVDPTQTYTAQDIMDAVNNQSTQTHVLAVLDSNGKLALESIDNKAMNISGAAGIGLTGITDGTDVKGKYLRLESSDPDIQVSGAQVNNLFGGSTVEMQPESSIGSINLLSHVASENTIRVTDRALSQINLLRANMGALSNRLEYTMNSSEIMYENISAAQSRIRDTDYAEETSNLTKEQIIQQAGISVLSQANQTPKSVLTLLQNV